MPSPDQFRYDGFAIDPARSVVTCRYATGSHPFTERFTFGTGGDWDDPAVRAAVRLLYLMAGVSYYKTTAAPLIELDEPTTPEERGFLADYYLGGLAEFSYRNGLDLRGLARVGARGGTSCAGALRPRTRTAPHSVRRRNRLHRDGGVDLGRPPASRPVHRRPAR